MGAPGSLHIPVLITILINRTIWTKNLKYHYLLGIEDLDNNPIILKMDFEFTSTRTLGDDGI
jgi:hypothetical protein